MLSNVRFIMEKGYEVSSVTSRSGFSSGYVRLSLLSLSRTTLGQIGYVISLCWPCLRGPRSCFHTARFSQAPGLYAGIAQCSVRLRLMQRRVSPLELGARLLKNNTPPRFQLKFHHKTDSTDHQL